MTIYLACLIGVTSFMFAVCVAWLALSPFLIARLGARVVVLIVRGVPSLVFLFWMYFLIPRLLMVNISGMTSAIVALTIYHGAYMAEDIRGGIQAVNKGQWEARVPPVCALLTTLIYHHPTASHPCCSPGTDQPLCKSVHVYLSRFVAWNS